MPPKIKKQLSIYRNKLENNFEKIIWLICGSLMLIAGAFFSPLLFILVVYGLFLKTIGYWPKYFIFGKNVHKLPIGRVLNSKTKKPISLAIVRLYSKTNGRLLQTKVTNQDGVFSLLVPAGNYYIEVTKYGYNFPSSIHRGYCGSDIVVHKDLQYYIFQQTIFLDPITENSKETVSPLEIQISKPQLETQTN